jgi:hypothetical protein
MAQVYETLKFAAMLRLEEGMSMARREQRARDVMVMLGLDDVADVIVGSQALKVRGPPALLTNMYTRTQAHTAPCRAELRTAVSLS